MVVVVEVVIVVLVVVAVVEIAQPYRKVLYTTVHRIPETHVFMALMSRWSSCREHCE